MKIFLPFLPVGQYYHTSSCCIWKLVTMVLAPKLYQFLVGVFASMGSILFGYDLGVIAEV